MRGSGTYIERADDRADVRLTDRPEVDVLVQPEGRGVEYREGA